MKTVCRLLLLCFLAFIAVPSAFGFHVPPWDTGHQRFDGDDGDPNTDCGSGDGCDQSPCPCKGGSPVEVATGNFRYFMSSVFFQGVGPAVDLTLVYNTQALHAGPFGQGWSHPYDARIVETSDGTNFYAVYAVGSGNREIFTRNANGTYSAPPHLRETLTKNANGTFVHRDRYGAVERFDAEGRLTAIVDRNGNALNLQYDATGFLTLITDASGRRVTLAKGANGRVVSATDPMGNSWNFTYSAEGLLIRVADPLGNATRFEYSLGPLDSGGAAYPETRMTRILDPRGNPQTVIEYDSLGRVSRWTDQQANWTYSYNAASKTTTKRDSASTWTYRYNDNGNVTEITDPSGTSEQFVLDANFNLISYKDKNNRITSYTYDTFGNKLSVTDATSTTRNLTWNVEFSRPLTAVDGLNKKTTFEYDARGNLTRIQNALSEVTTNRFDSRGRLIETRNGLGQSWTFDYDSNGNLTRSTDPLGNTQTVAYDLLGRPTSASDGEGLTIQYSYDAAGRLTRITNSGAGVQVNEYDAASNLTAVTTPSNARTTFTYDTYNRLTAITNPRGQTISYTYDRRGNVASMRNARGQTVNYTYDTLNRLTRKTLPGDTVNFTYDPMSNMLTAVDGDSRVTNVYDARHRIIRSTAESTVLLPGFATVEYAYDTNSNRTQFRYPGGLIRYSYDSLARLSQITDDNGDVFTFTYDADGRRAGVQRPGSLSTTYGYDNAGRFTLLTHQGGPGPLAFSANYTRNGLRQSITTAAGSETFLYDSLERLTHVTRTGIPGGNESYSYDAVGNRIASHLASAATFDSANRLLSDSKFTYQYDADGNLISKTETGSGQITGYVYDAENRLTQINLPGGGQATYRYDALGRRISKTVGGATRVFLWDGPDVVAEFEGGLLQARYTFGHGWDELLSVTRGSTTSYFQTDQLGSVVRVVSGGATVAEYAYDSFGNVVSESGTSVSPHRYRGRELDSESGLYYVRTRYYDPATGRFISEDPARLMVGPNSYSYVGNNPVNFGDPSGLILETIWDVANVVMDVTSLAGNIATGNFAGAALDAAGLVVDAAATLTPGVPGGAGAAIKAARLSEKALEAARRKAVREAWKQECDLMRRTGRGTRDWTEAEAKDLLKNGKVKGYDGHHINNVKDHPHMAGDPNNIEFVNPQDHLGRHNGNWRNPTSGPTVSR